MFDQGRDPWRGSELSGLQRAVLGIVWALLIFAGSLFLSGCKTRPEPAFAPAVSCEPLPLCSIPPKASSTQLETALYACVLEYRALYSSCANRRPNADTVGK